MTTPTVAIVAQYVRKLSAVASVRPYQNKTAVRTEIGVSAQLEQLPEPGHYRLVLGVSADVRNDTDLCLHAECEMEAITVLSGESEDAQALVKASVVPLLFASVRAQIANATMTTGYGPVTLPPIPSDRLIALLSNA